MSGLYFSFERYGNAFPHASHLCWPPGPVPLEDLGGGTSK